LKYEGGKRKIRKKRGKWKSDVTSSKEKGGEGEGVAPSKKTRKNIVSRREL